MVWREAHGVGVRADVGDAHRLGVGDQRAEHPAALGQRADGRHDVRVHATVDELHERAVGAEDAERRVAGAPSWMSE
jgi:hypothetical protein